MTAAGHIFRPARESERKRAGRGLRLLELGLGSLDRGKFLFSGPVAGALAANGEARNRPTTTASTPNAIREPTLWALSKSH